MLPCDFKDQLVGEVIIPSSWHKEITSTDATTQTSQLKTVETETQTATSAVSVSEKLEKCEGHDRAMLAQSSLQGGLQYVYTNTPPYDEEKLTKFLEEAEPTLLSILHKNTRTNFFDHYEPNWSRKSTELALVHTLSSPVAIEHDLHALDIAWNCTGTIIAVAYGRLDVSGWCNASGFVCLWNITREEVDPHAPNITLEIDTYVTRIAFHPTESLQLAVGTYGGDVLVYPSVQENVSLSTSQGCFTHKDPVSSVQWVQNLQELREPYRYTLCVASQDGMISIWSLASKLKTPLAIFGVSNRRHCNAGISSITYARSSVDAKGVTAAAIDSTIMVGLESGEVGRGRTPVIMNADNEEVKTVSLLALDWLENHCGPVQAVESSPFFRQLFLSCSSDGTARLYNVMESRSQLTLEPSADTRHFLYDAQFSPFRPAVVAVVSRSSHLHLYDLQKSTAKPMFSSEAGVDGAAVVCVKFCESSAEWIATADTRGNARVWKVPTNMTQQTEVERSVLRSLHENKKGEAPQPNLLRDLFGFSF